MLSVCPAASREQLSPEVRFPASGAPAAQAVEHLALASSGEGRQLMALQVCLVVMLVLAAQHWGLLGGRSPMACPCPQCMPAMPLVDG
jgi:hypothetical protein